LLGLKPGAADRIWSVQWILRGALPDLQELARNDLDVAAAVELDELKHSGRTIQLLHEIRSFPSAWPPGDPPTSLADQYQQIAGRPRILSDEALQSLIDANRELTSGWKQRLTSILPSVDPEQILARLRTDGATWFAPNFGLTDEGDEESGGIDSYDDIEAEQDASVKGKVADNLDEATDIDAEYTDDEDAPEEESDD
jgi:hypothetical protein